MRVCCAPVIGGVTQSPGLDALRRVFRDVYITPIANAANVDSQLFDVRVGLRRVHSHNHEMMVRSSLSHMRPLAMHRVDQVTDRTSKPLHAQWRQIPDPILV